jgi:hypothetical protein
LVWGQTKEGTNKPQEGWHLSRENALFFVKQKQNKKSDG